MAPVIKYARGARKHLLGCLTGKGKKKYLSRVHPLLYQVGYAVYQYPGLSAAGSGNDQAGAFCGPDRFKLGGI